MRTKGKLVKAYEAHMKSYGEYIDALYPEGKADSSEKDYAPVVLASALIMAVIMQYLNPEVNLGIVFMLYVIAMIIYKVYKNEAA
jgi:K+-sensing histidine kinase KdpD